MLAILKCPNCGKVYPDYNAGKTRACCPNIQVCQEKFWIDSTTMMNVKFSTEFTPERDTAYIYINVFNSNCYLAVRAYSEDAGNFLVIPLSERKIGELTRKNTLSAIPTDFKHQSAWDGLVIKSGCYPVSAEMEREIRKNLYVSVPEVTA
jgi:hypothetical protein